MGGSFRQAPNEPAQRLLRAIDLRTSKVVWEVPQTGNVNSWGACELAGRVVSLATTAAHSPPSMRQRRRLWSFQTSQLWKASPMTYVFEAL